MANTGPCPDEAWESLICGTCMLEDEYATCSGKVGVRRDKKTPRHTSMGEIKATSLRQPGPVRPEENLKFDRDGQRRTAHGLRSMQGGEHSSARQQRPHQRSDDRAILCRSLQRPGGMPPPSMSCGLKARKGACKNEERKRAPLIFLGGANAPRYRPSKRGRGGIGRRSWFRSKRRKVWGFESLRPHHSSPGTAVASKSP